MGRHGWGSRSKILQNRDIAKPPEGDGEGAEDRRDAVGDLAAMCDAVAAVRARLGAGCMRRTLQGRKQPPSPPRPALFYPDCQLTE